MKRQHLPFYAIATAILIVELVAFGVPASSLFLLAFVFVCPLMMLVIMHGGSSQDSAGQADRPTEDRDHRSRLGGQ